MKVHAHLFSVCFFSALENLEQTNVSGFGSLKSQQDFRTPEFVSTTYSILNLYQLPRERGFVCLKLSSWFQGL